MKKILVVMVVGLIWANKPALGNAGVFGGFGQDVQLINSKDIQMVSEDISITLGTTNKSETVVGAGFSEGFSARYNCEFHLVNHSNQQVTVQVGFPLNAAFFKYSHLAADEIKKTADSFQFTADDGAQKYPLRFSHSDKEGKFETIFLWDMTFAAGESKNLHVTYRMPFSVVLRNTQKDLNIRRKPSGKPWYRRFSDCNTLYFGYVTETGKSWAGKIEHARFRIDPHLWESQLEQLPFKGTFMPSDERLDQLNKDQEERDQQFAKELENKPAGLKSPSDQDFGQRMAAIRQSRREEQRAGFPLETPAYFREIEPTGWIETTDGALVWEAKDYLPGASITIGYNYIFCMPRTKEDIQPLIQRTFKGTLTEEDAQDLSDIIRAFYGGKVENPRLVDFLQNQRWCPAAANKKLPPGILEAITNWKKQ